MPQAYIYETAVTVDHETGVMLVDTTVARVATALLKAGFTEITQPGSRPYRRFRGDADQIRFRGPKGDRRRGSRKMSPQDIARLRKTRGKIDDLRPTHTRVAPRAESPVETATGPRRG